MLVVKAVKTCLSGPSVEMFSFEQIMFICSLILYVFQVFRYEYYFPTKQGCFEGETMPYLVFAHSRHFLLAGGSMNAGTAVSLRVEQRKGTCQKKHYSNKTVG